MEYQNDSELQTFPDREDRTPMPPPPPQEPPAYDIPPLKPNNWLWQSIVATLLCCMPFGIVGIIYAAKVDSLYFNGKYEEAERIAQKAKMWTLIAVGAALLYVIFWVILVVTGNLPEYMENIIENNASGYNF
ncbi:CD225/dispanin family protein [uncultured Proteiniphilum sp.]|uniref:CD225/dispanin family protein n=1 Tax=uncultured Proteiniphilum sp. TaxID=497637 RepID=UPI0026283F70|nr:CD225/dispanin family protein [uncultured Proteiniphilum sp.]